MHEGLRSEPVSGAGTEVPRLDVLVNDFVSSDTSRGRCGENWIRPIIRASFKGATPLVSGVSSPWAQQFAHGSA